MRAIVFANGNLHDPDVSRLALGPDDLIIAADGGGRHCLRLGITPHVVIGDLDSLPAPDLERFVAAGAQVMRYPVRKDYTDLELALGYARDRGVAEVLLLGALGGRWDQTLANLLLPAAVGLEAMCIRILDGLQEIALLRGGGRLEMSGCPGDTLSLIPIGGAAQGIVTSGLEYPLQDETLWLGSTRGVSNVFLGHTAGIHLCQGLLLCVVIHQPLEG